MTDKTYSISEIVGTSSEGVDQAIRNAIDKAGQSLHNLDWFEVVEIRGALREGAVFQFQVTIKLGFRVD